MGSRRQSSHGKSGRFENGIYQEAGMHKNVVQVHTGEWMRFIDIYLLVAFWLLQAADSFGPKLEAMVVSGKEIVRKRAADIEVELVKLRGQLSVEYEESMKQFRSHVMKQFQVAKW